MNSWPEKNFEESQSENINNIYRAMFPNIKQIKRSKRGASKEQLYFDKSLGIDTFITFDNGSQITVQEKVRRGKSLEEYNPCLCIEYMNDISKVGEWFYAIPQYYFVGYVNTYTNNIIEWYLIDTARLKTIFMNWSQKELEEKYLKKNVPPKRSSFLAIPINDIRQAVIEYNNYT